MQALVEKYERKLVDHGLAQAQATLIGGLDAEFVWNRQDPRCSILEQIAAGLNINSLLLARPREPYFSIINNLCRSQDTLLPNDCETRTFLHEIPVVPALEPQAVIAALKRRKSVIIPTEGVMSYGTVSPEQAFVTFSSVCFAAFVKLFLDYYLLIKAGKQNHELRELVRSAGTAYGTTLAEAQRHTPDLQGPFAHRVAAIQAMIEAGNATVQARMVDSYFGNISYRLADTIMISQTASSMDELAGCIDACPLDGSSCVGLTASSEYPAHRLILSSGQYGTLLHGHPKFSVIRSMMCDEIDCPGEGSCHLTCHKTRSIKDTPIVPGEVGAGKYGLCNTVPAAIADSGKAIVYGHGVFAAGKSDFRAPFQILLEVERACWNDYFVKTGQTDLVESATDGRGGPALSLKNTHPRS